MSPSYILGVIAGVIFGLAIVCIIFLLVKKLGHTTDEEFKAKYDERQDAARGKAFKYAFYAMLIGVAIELLYHVNCPEGFVPVEPIYLDMGIMLLGLLVYASVAIWKNAYIGFNQTYKRSVILLSVIAAINIVIGVMNFTASTTAGFINLLLGGAMAILCIEMVIKHRVDLKESDQDCDENCDED